MEYLSLYLNSLLLWLGDIGGHHEGEGLLQSRLGTRHKSEVARTWYFEGIQARPGIPVTVVWDCGLLRHTGHLYHKRIVVKV